MTPRPVYAANPCAAACANATALHDGAPADASPRAIAVAAAVAQAALAHRFTEAAAMLREHMNAERVARDTRIQTLFAMWLDLPAEAPPGFWEWSHGRQRDGGGS